MLVPHEISWQSIFLNKQVVFLSCFKEPRETLLHLAVLVSDQTSLHIVDFLVQNR